MIDLGAVLQTAMSCGTVLYLVRRVETRLDARAEAVKAKAAALVVPKSFAPPPLALVNFAMAQSEPWAREQGLARLYELYHECGDWDKVAARIEP